MTIFRVPRRFIYDFRDARFGGADLRVSLAVACIGGLCRYVTERLRKPLDVRCDYSKTEARAGTTSVGILGERYLTYQP